MRYSFDDAGADERHETQYFEMFGNRGIYHKGWTAVTGTRLRGYSSARRSRRSTTTYGSSTTPAWTGRSSRTSRRSTRRSSTNSSGCS